MDGGSLQNLKSSSDNKLAVNQLTNQTVADPDKIPYYDYKEEQIKSEWLTVHKIKEVSFYVVAGCALAIIVVYIWHLIGFECLCWLSPERLDLLGKQALSILPGLAVGLVISLMHDK